VYFSARVVKLITEVLSGTHTYCYDGKCLDPKKIVTVIGDYSSHVSREVSTARVH